MEPTLILFFLNAFFLFLFLLPSIPPDEALSFLLSETEITSQASADKHPEPPYVIPQDLNSL
jgi:hypothetical protein